MPVYAGKDVGNSGTTILIRRREEDTTMPRGKPHTHVHKTQAAPAIAVAVDVAEPTTWREAKAMVFRGWGWLLRRYPALMLPATAYMAFGGLLFVYNTMTSNTFKIKDAVPLGENAQPPRVQPEFNLTSVAHAVPTGNAMGARPIVFEGRTWGYEDTTFEARVAIDRPVIIVHDRVQHRVYDVDFNNGESIRKQFRK